MRAPSQHLDLQERHYLPGWSRTNKINIVLAWEGFWIVLILGYRRLIQSFKRGNKCLGQRNIDILVNRGSSLEIATSDP